MSQAPSCRFLLRFADRAEDRAAGGSVAPNTAWKPGRLAPCRRSALSGTRSWLLPVTPSMHPVRRILCLPSAWKHSPCGIAPPSRELHVAPWFSPPSDLHVPSLLDTHLDPMRSARIESAKQAAAAAALLPVEAPLGWPAMTSLVEVLPTP
jgi:hypothetical protein